MDVIGTIVIGILVVALVFALGAAIGAWWDY